MLVQYAVENYKSIKDEVVINFSADEKPKDTRWVMKEDGLPELYKSIGLIGPNASGKTNIIESFIFAFRFIWNTIERKESSAINIDRFDFEEECRNKPAAFEFIFYQNKIKYVYGFSVNDKEVIEEYLMGYFTAKPKTLFNRMEGHIYDFRGNDVKLQKEISMKTNKNRLYMPVAAEWGYQPIKEAHDWFDFNSRQYFGYDVNMMIGEIIKTEKNKNILIRELRKADFNISDIYIKKHKIDSRAQELAVKIINEYVGELGDYTLPNTRPSIQLIHENKDGKEFEIPLDEDSAGTQEIVQNIAELLFLTLEGGLMLEDELGKVYHTKLTQHFLNMVKSDEINTGNVQLLFTSHDTKILNTVNPDQIYLVDKDEAGATIVKLLSDFIIRENDNVELGYLKGRYGSIPYMKG